MNRAANLEFEFVWDAAADPTVSPSPRQSMSKAVSEVPLLKSDDAKDTARPRSNESRGGARDLEMKADEAEYKARRAEQRVVNAEERLKQFTASSVTALKLKFVLPCTHTHARSIYFDALP